MAPKILFVTLLALTSAAACQFESDVVIGDKAHTYDHHIASSAQDCCLACNQSSACAAYTFETSEGVCYLKSSAVARSPKQGAISGLKSSGGNTFNMTLDDSRIAFTTLPQFKSWNIDASENREFFTRNLSNPELQYLAQHSMPGLLRFGGSGNDGLVYAFGNTTCGSSPCLNQSWFDNLMGFASAAKAPLIFGLNVETRAEHPAGGHGAWDPTQARALMMYAQQAGYKFYGFELGNEQNTHYTPAESAKDFAVLQALLVELWPGAADRPLVGLRAPLDREGWVLTGEGWVLTGGGG